MKFKIGDAIKALEDGDVNVLLHQANTKKNMGGGIAKVLATKFPKVKDADDKSDSELGTHSWAKVCDNGYVMNLYTQKGVGNDGDPTHRNTSYDVLYNLLYALNAQFRDGKFSLKVCVPYGYGSDLAGGDWRIVKTIFAAAMPDTDLTCYKLPSAPFFFPEDEQDFKDTQ